MCDAHICTPHICTHGHIDSVPAAHMHREDGLPCVAIVHYFFLFYTSSRGVREICLWELSLTVLVLAFGTSL